MTRQKGKTLTAEAWHGYKMMLRAMIEQHHRQPIPRMVAMFGPACFTDYVPPAPSLGPPDDGLMPSQRAIINATRKRP